MIPNDAIHQETLYSGIWVSRCHHARQIFWHLKLDILEPAPKVRYLSTGARVLPAMLTGSSCAE